MNTTTNTHPELRHTPRTALLAALVGLALLATPSASQASSETTPTRAGAGVEGSLDKHAVREVVRAHIDDVRECYDAELSEREDLAGDTVVAFVIAGDGSVGAAEIASSSMPARFDACLLAAVEQWSFPATGGQTSVNYPFKMTVE